MIAKAVLPKVSRLVYWCLVLAKHRYPQWLTGILGSGGGGVGVLFIAVPDRFVGTSVDAMFALFPSTLWGLLFLVIGVALVTTSIVNPSTSGVLCVILGLSFFLFAFLTAGSAFEGNSTGLSTVLALTLGALCWVGMFASISPQVEQILQEKASKDSGTEE